MPIAKAISQRRICGSMKGGAFWRSEYQDWSIRQAITAGGVL
jgi:hypothetical protein